jgi:hypothetical protein
MLSFKTAPQQPVVALGDSETGVLEILRYGDLLLAERLWINERSTDIPSLQKEAVKLAKQCTGIALLTAYLAIINHDLVSLEDHFEKAIDFQDWAKPHAEKRSLLRATALIIHRLNSQWTIEDSRDHTKIHPRLLGLISDFALSEEAGEAPPKPLSEGDLKKLNPSRRKSPTGKISTGV